MGNKLVRYYGKHPLRVVFCSALFGLLVSLLIIACATSV